MHWILIAAASAGEPQTLTGAQLRQHLTQTQRATGPEMLVAAWSVRELQDATQTLDIEGLSLHSMGQTQGRAWLEQRQDCVLLVQRLDTDSWSVEAFGDCREAAPAPAPAPRPEPAVNPEMVWKPNLRPQFQLGFQAGLASLDVLPAPSVGMHTGFQLGSPVSVGVRGLAEYSGLQLPDYQHQLAHLGGELLVELERPRNSFMLSGGPMLFNETTWGMGQGTQNRAGQRWTAALGWHHPTTLRNDKSRIAHGLLLRTTFSPRAVKTVSLQWTFGWDWRV